jgi:hypothetical protein
MRAQAAIAVFASLTIAAMLTSEGRACLSLVTPNAYKGAVLT